MGCSLGMFLGLLFGLLRGLLFGNAPGNCPWTASWAAPWPPGQPRIFQGNLNLGNLRMLRYVALCCFMSFYGCCFGPRENSDFL